MARKTIEVERVKEMVNNLLASYVDTEAKMAASTLLESVLFETGNYKGFSYLDSKAALSGDMNAEYTRYYR